MATLLDQELSTYQVQKKNLIGKARGKFVLIKGEEVVGIFDTRLDAVRQGYKQFGNAPFLTKEIVEVEIPLNFTSNLIGL